MEQKMRLLSLHPLRKASSFFLSASVGGWPTIVGLALTLLPATGSAQQAGEQGVNAEAQDGDLAKKTQNPIADLISVPIQNNFDFLTGPGHPLKYAVNIQPVIPASISQDWNLISRIIMPVFHQEGPLGAQDRDGLGDINPSFFFSPKASENGITWGVGPVFLLPTATDSRLGSQKFGLGPSVVVLRQDDGWTYGALVNQIWSVAGDHNWKDVNATFLQPFVAYTFPTFTTVGLNMESSLDWAQRQWTAPINLSVSQIVRIAGQPVSLQLGGKYYVDRPVGGPDWGLRFTVTLLFPR
jgi:hypothetical protein